VIGVFRFRRRPDKAHADTAVTDKRVPRLMCDIGTVIDLMPALTKAEADTLLRAAMARMAGHPCFFSPRPDRAAAADELIQAARDSSDVSAIAHYSGTSAASVCPPASAPVGRHAACASAQ
jgi:hypothetical protein